MNCKWDDNPTQVIEFLTGYTVWLIKFAKCTAFVSLACLYFFEYAKPSFD